MKLLLALACMLNMPEPKEYPDSSSREIGSLICQNDFLYAKKLTGCHNVSQDELVIVTTEPDCWKYGKITAVNQRKKTACVLLEENEPVELPFTLLRKLAPLESKKRSKTY